MSHKCKECNKIFKSKSGLWKHFNNHRNEIEEINRNQENDIFCSYCNKQLAYRQGKWRHEQKCKLISKPTVSEQIKQLSDEIQKIKENPINNVLNNNNNSNNQTTNNIQLIINPIGSEDINKLSFAECREILDKKLNCITHMAEKLNFNRNMPENHSYCVTAINDKHATVINPETNTLTKTDKETLFDKLLISYFDKLETIAKNSKFKNREREEYSNIIKQLKELLFQKKRYIKRYYMDLNYMSYNNKDLVKNTWNKLPEKKLFDKLQMSNEQLGFDDLTGDSITEGSEDELIKRKQQELREKFKKSKLTSYETTSDSDSDSDDKKSKLNSSSESESEDEHSQIKQQEQKEKCNSKIRSILKLTQSSSESDSESDLEDYVINEITIKNKIYILDGSNVYVKTKTGLKGELYGTYSDGKVKRIRK